MKAQRPLKIGRLQVQFSSLYNSSSAVNREQPQRRAWPCLHLSSDGVGLRLEGKFSPLYPPTEGPHASALRRATSSPGEAPAVSHDAE